MEEKLQQNLTDTIDKFETTLEGFSQEQINQVPFEGSWTGGQVCEHILKSGSGLPALLKSPGLPVDRDPKQFFPVFDDIMLNFDRKLQSPDFIIPSNAPHDKEQLLTWSHDLKKQLLDTFQYDLTKECQGFELPRIGKVTGLEWIYFFTVHMQRHTRQLQNIHSKL